MKINFKFLLWNFTLLILLCSCANPYISHFVSISNQRISDSNYKHQTVSLKDDDEIKIYAVEDMIDAEQAMLENGYVPLGSSKFNSAEIDDRQAISAARDLGASVILIKNKFTRTRTETIPFNVRQPDQTTTIRDVKVKSDGQVTTREKKITVEGEYQTVYTQQSTDYYDYTAVFWAKLKNPKLGLFVSDLNTAQKQQLQSNRGVAVQAVVKGTPGFIADILKNDILLKINEERINEKKHFFKLINENIGKEFEISGIRNNAPFSVKIKISK